MKVKGEEDWRGGWGRVDEAFKGFKRKENSPPLLKMWNTLPSPYSLIHSPIHSLTQLICIVIY